MKLINFLFGMIFSISMILVLLITSMEAALYWSPGYFEKEYNKYDVTESVNMEMDDLLYVTDVMMDYLRDDRDDLQVVTVVNDSWRTFFSQRELAHMIDVKNLFTGGLLLRRICLLVAAACVALIYFLKGKPSKILPRAMCIGTGVFFALVCLLAVLVSTDFTKYFTIFHEIFFDNDLWLLDPDTDLLINIVPEPFFIDTAMRIGALFGSSILLVLAGCMAVLHWQKKRGYRYQNKPIKSVV